ncbi:MAG: Ig-like domain-containing protein [Gemmatimonadota bacterium]
MKSPLPLILLLLAGCAATPTDSSDTPQNVVLTLPVAEIKVGDEIQLTAVARNGLDFPLPATPIDWSTDLPAVATVTAAGRLRGVAAGTVMVTARSGSASATRSVIVRPIEPNSITLSPLPATLTAGGHLQFVADVRADGGYQLQNASVTWSVTGTALASISVTGDLTPLTAGVITVTAVSGTATASHTLTVLPAPPASVQISGGARTIRLGETTTLTASVIATTGTTIADAQVVWSSSDPTVVTVTSSGEVTGVGVGQASINASFGALSRSVPMLVSGTITPTHRIAYIREYVGGERRLEVIAESGELILSVRPSIDFRVATFASQPTVTLSPDGKTIAYDCLGGVCLLQLATGSATLLLYGGYSEPTWSADGSTLVLRGDYSSVVQYNLVTDEITTLRAPFYVERPRLSPDGQMVIYECDFSRLYEAQFSLCRMNASGNVTLYRTYGNAVSFAADGRMAYIRSVDEVGSFRFLVVEPPQSSPAPSGPGVAEFVGFADVTEMTWSPDGQRLLLVRNGELWVVSIPGAGDQRPFGTLVPGSRISSISWR